MSDTKAQGYVVESLLHTKGCIGRLLDENVPALKKIESEPAKRVLLYNTFNDGIGGSENLDGYVGSVKKVHWGMALPISSSSLFTESKGEITISSSDINAGHISIYLGMDDKNLSIPVEFESGSFAHVFLSEDSSEPEFSVPESSCYLVDGQTRITIGNREINLAGKGVAPQIEYLTSEFLRYLERQKSKFA